MECTPDRIFFPRRTEFIGIGVFVVLLSGMGIWLLAEMLPLEDGYTAADVAGVIILCLWTLLILTLGMFALLFNMKQVTLDNAGVCSKGLFTEKQLAWGEIREFGLSYSGQTRFIGNTYTLYFATEEQKEKGKYKKRLRGTMIRLFVFSGEYPDIAGKMVPFCQKRTKAVCFLPQDVHHYF